MLPSTEVVISRRRVLSRIIQVAALCPLASMAACGGARSANPPSSTASPVAAPATLPATPAFSPVPAQPAPTIGPTTIEQKVQNAQARFVAGNLAMYPQGNYFQGYATSEAKFHWDLAPLPKGAVGRRPLAGGANFLLPNGVKHPEASWLLMKYMGGPEGATFRGREAGLFPSMPALAKPEIVPQFSAAQISNILASGQDAIPLPFVAKYAQMDKVTNAGLAPVWQGQATAKEATAKLVPQVNALLQG